jgi:hypothetical protein
MKRTAAINARGCVSTIARYHGAEKHRSVLTANPRWRSDDFKHAPYPNPLRNHVISGSYRLARVYSKATNKVANRNPMTIDLVSMSYRLVFR